MLQIISLLRSFRFVRLVRCLIYGGLILVLLFPVVAFASTITYDDNNSTYFTYSGSWNYQTNCSPYCYANSLHWSQQTGAVMDIIFTGTHITLYMTTWNDRGKFDVYLDGVLVVSGVDSYSNTPSIVKDVVAYDSGTLAYDFHQLHVVILGTKQTASSNTIVAFDYITLDLSLPTATASPVPSATNTLTFTPSPTVTASPTITLTPTLTITPSITPSPTLTLTPSATPIVRDIGYLSGYSKMCLDPVNPILLIPVFMISMPVGFVFTLWTGFSYTKEPCFDLVGSGDVFFFLQSWATLLFMAFAVLVALSRQ